MTRYSDNVPVATVILLKLLCLKVGGMLRFLVSHQLNILGMISDIN